MVYRHSLVDVNRMPLDRSSAKQAWQGVTDPKLRRLLQNRENQRLSRKRKATQREALRQALEARRASPATAPKPILPKPAGVQPRDTDQPKPLTLQNDEAIWVEKGETAHTPIWSTPILSGSSNIVSERLPRSLFIAHFVVLRSGGASHLRFLTNSIEDNRVLLKAQSQIARTVRQQLSTGITAISDTVLFSIMIMSVDQSPYLLSLAPEDRYAGDFDTPVKSFGGLVWQGLINFVATHTSMWMHLLNARDPSSSDTVPGLIDWLQVSELLRASALLRKPDMKMQLAYRLQADKAAAIRPHASEADVFPVDPHFKDIILDIKECCRLIDTLSGREHPLSPEASDFVQYRNLILYRLLSLPPGVSEICRLTALVFNYGVLYPFPDPRILWTLTGQLGAVLSDPQHTTNEEPGLLLWAAVIGGIAAAGTVAYDSFAVSVNKFAGLLRLEDWSQIAAHLESFIWLERACGVGGRNLWARAQALALSSKGFGYLHLASRPKAIIEDYVD
ncbi:hypothetical protein LY76DRAFT_634747 [Colletotrichum caudatum]|nr:hypothetical protein LY76DRAFT_634747 [Colletotrichum caudatum]